MKIDLIVETNMKPDAIAEFGALAESRGIHGLWTCDYFAHWDDGDDWQKNPLSGHQGNNAQDCTKGH